MKQKRRKDIKTLQRQYAKHRVASPDGHLRQSAQSLRSSTGYVCRTAIWSESSGKPVASGKLDEVQILTLLSQKCQPMKSDRETCCNISRCFEAGLRYSSMLFLHQEEKKINLFAENIRCLEMKKELAFFKDSSHPIFRCTSPLERRRKDKNLLQLKHAQSSRSSGGYD